MSYQDRIKKQQEKARQMTRRMKRQVKARVRAHMNGVPHVCPLEGRA